MNPNKRGPVVPTRWALWSALAAVLVSSQLLGQTPLNRATLYIAFLHQHAQEAQRRALQPSRGATSLDRAKRLGIASTELSALDQNAVAFISQEEALRQEALRYHQDCRAANTPVDPAVIHSFAVRRAELATSTMRVIQAKMSESSAVGLESFIGEEFAKGISVWR